jgi:hypothetical protein
MGSCSSATTGRSKGGAISSSIRVLPLPDHPALTASATGIMLHIVVSRYVRLVARADEMIKPAVVFSEPIPRGLPHSRKPSSADEPRRVLHG